LQVGLRMGACVGGWRGECVARGGMHWLACLSNAFR
jgi:hypothetical protein